MRAKRMLVLTGVLVLGLSAWAAEPAPEAKTLMTERGKLLFSDDLTQPLGKEWKAAKGKWEVVDGAVRSSELKDDMHGAVARHAMPFHNVVVQYSFKLEGAKQTTFSINATKGHLCRVLVNPQGFTVRKDDSDKKGPDQAAILETRSTPIKPGEWHTLVIELQGKEMLASLDGKEIVFGEHAALDVLKANFGLTVSGESVSFKNLRVWEAQPSKGWEAAKARLVLTPKRQLPCYRVNLSLIYYIYSGRRCSGLTSLPRSMMGRRWSKPRPGATPRPSASWPRWAIASPIPWSRARSTRRAGSA